MTMRKHYNIAVAGLGYVGLSIAILLAQHHRVYAVDIDPVKVQKINEKVSPIQDVDLESLLSDETLCITATTDSEMAYGQADYVIVAVPTNYDDCKKTFDTSAVEEVIRQVRACNEQAVIVIKSTVPVGYTNKLRVELGVERVLFSPEFLREGRAIYDNLYPSRIVVGAVNTEQEEAEVFAAMMMDGAYKEHIEVVIMGLEEAEAVKLFANTYLALRVSYFNELDTYAEIKGLNTEQIIQGVCLDPRIGNHYNNPSFGYGGYCLPKDTKQLLENYRDVPENLIEAIIVSNQTRKEYVVQRILKLAGYSPAADNNHITIGIYRLSMKTGSDNFRNSAVLDIMKRLSDRDIRMVIYEPLLSGVREFCNSAVEDDLACFKSRSTIILANRVDQSIQDVMHKVYTRDIFGCN